jgi:methyltransferase (TIGR00027 family)
MALFRAIESNRPASSRLFEDPLASAFLDRRLRWAAAAARFSLGRAIVPWIIDRGWPGPRGSAVVRTRMIDDALAGALTAGTRQVVILGAGFDTRAYRVPGIERARVFELDQEAMIASKTAGVRRRLAGAVPPHVTLVAVDFNRDDLGDVLRGAGFDPSARTFFIWEGVTNYLTPEAVDAALRDIAALAPPQSAVVFTYIHRDLLEDPARFEGGPETTARVRSVGEPFRFGFDPAELPAYLRARGLALERDEATAEAAHRYLAPLGRNESVVGFYRVALAQVEDEQRA